MADITTLGAPIKTTYEGQPNTNAFTDAEKEKLADVPSSFDSNTVGLGNVDNTSDLNKPISTATQTALNLKVSSNVSGITGADAITNMVSLTQAEYDALTPSSTTFYVITDA